MLECEFNLLVFPSTSSFPWFLSLCTCVIILHPQPKMIFTTMTTTLMNMSGHLRYETACSSPASCPRSVVLPPKSPPASLSRPNPSARSIADSSTVSEWDRIARIRQHVSFCVVRLSFLPSFLPSCSFAPRFVSHRFHGLFYPVCLLHLLRNLPSCSTASPLVTRRTA